MGGGDGGSFDLQRRRLYVPLPRKQVAAGLSLHGADEDLRPGEFSAARGVASGSAPGDGNVVEIDINDYVAKQLGYPLPLWLFYALLACYWLLLAVWVYDGNVHAKAEEITGNLRTRWPGWGLGPFHWIIGRFMAYSRLPTAAAFALAAYLTWKHGWGAAYVDRWMFGLAAVHLIAAGLAFTAYDACALKENTDRSKAGTVK